MLSVAAVERTEMSSSSPTMKPVDSDLIRAFSPQKGGNDATMLESAPVRRGYAGIGGVHVAPHDETMMSTRTSLGGLGYGGAGPIADLEHYCHHPSLLLSSPSIDDGLQQCDDRLKLTTNSSTTRRQPVHHQQYSPLATTNTGASIHHPRENVHPTAGHGIPATQPGAQQQFLDGFPSTSSGTAAAPPDVNVSSTGHSPLNAFNFPSFLPPPPKLKSATSSSSSSSLPTSRPSTVTDQDMFDFAQMSANYLNMLQSNPEDNHQDASPQASHPGLPEMPFQYSRPTGGESRVSSGNDMQVSPMFASPHEEFLTSPLLDEDYREFMSPDFDTPFSTFLSTPDFGASAPLPPMSRGTLDDTAFHVHHGNSDAYNMPLIHNPAAYAYDDSPLIPFDESYSGLSLVDGSEQPVIGEGGAAHYNNGLLSKQPAPTTTIHQHALAPSALSSSVQTPPTPNPTVLDSDQMYTMSPAIDDVDEFPAPTGRAAATAPSRRQLRGASNKYTGTRRNVTPSTLIPDDAPIQRRNYGGGVPTPVKRTSKKRTASEAFDSSTLTTEEELEAAREQGLLSQAEYKRIQNTLAARKSRKRKLQHQIDLEDKVESMSKERDMWKDRALMLAGMLRAQGMEVQFDD